MSGNNKRKSSSAFHRQTRQADAQGLNFVFLFMMQISHCLDTYMKEKGGARNDWGGKGGSSSLYYNSPPPPCFGQILCFSSNTKAILGR